MKNTVVVSAALAASVLLLATAAYASHEPDKPYMTVAYPFDKPNIILYKVGLQGSVPLEYKTAANEAFVMWGDKLTARGGEWRFVKSGFGEDIHIRLIYDQNGASRFCKNFLAGRTPEDNVGTRTAIFVGCKDKFLDVEDVRVGMLHRVGHALGLGPALGGAVSVMCDTYDARDGLCTRTGKPTDFDLYCVTRLYGADGFGTPNPHYIPTFCTQP